MYFERYGYLLFFFKSKNYPHIPTPMLACFVLVHMFLKKIYNYPHRPTHMSACFVQKIYNNYPHRPACFVQKIYNNYPHIPTHMSACFVLIHMFPKKIYSRSPNIRFLQTKQLSFEILMIEHKKNMHRVGIDNTFLVIILSFKYDLDSFIYPFVIQVSHQMSNMNFKFLSQSLNK